MRGSPDEVIITINGRKHWLWRGVDQFGAVLDARVQIRHDRHAAERLMRKLRKKHGHLPRVLITYKPKRYAATNKHLGISLDHRQHNGLNNRAENSLQPTRVREKVRRRFKWARQLQRFTSTHDLVANLFMHCRYNTTAQAKREARTQAVSPAFNKLTVPSACLTAMAADGLRRSAWPMPQDVCQVSRTPCLA